MPVCSDALEATVELGTPGTIVTWVTPFATDNSGQATILSNNYNPGDFFNVGTTTVVYVFQDPSGNTASCSYPVTVIAGEEYLPVGGGGALVFQAGYHPHKRTFKTHPNHIFFRYGNRPLILIFAAFF